MSAARAETDWQDLAATSHYQTAVAVKQALADGDVTEAERGLQELIDAVARSEKRALRGQLVRLMAHVLKWHIQPERRSSSWSLSIYQAREEIAAIRDEVPSLTRTVVEHMWGSCFESAKRQARAETKKKVTVAALTWADVFEVEYLEEAADGDV